ncbi:ATPase, T2SS/T4P/T4SS family [Thauera sp.]|jgi:pilus assembly protein CpaF|uniref:ATPase, T2SS/T4P/T4SS family n=1 Tax=Thauera sp. TaxID=1905334 RepID=UPI002A3604C5|nr:ATPase, T2SS/T4P/T4SS family [Thauera sp.]MDX9887071.1 ATPase, T2SS/T4P/T4SS family [Thauera sp.]
MFQVTIRHPESAPRVESITDTSAIIGKGRECRLRLPGWKIGREHARIYRSKTGLYIQDLGQFFGTTVNGARIQQHGPIAPTDQIVVGPFTLVIEDRIQAQGTINDAPAGPADDAMAAGATGVSERSAPAPGTHQGHASHAPLPAHPARAARAPAAPAAPTPEQFWRKHLHEALLDAIDLRRRDLVRMSDAELRAETESLLIELIDQEAALPESIDRDSLRRDVLDEAVGLGPLEALLDDDSITEIMVNRHDEIYIERRGRLERHSGSFTSDRAVLGVIERIVTPIGRRIDESSPMVDARLKDGSRVNAIIPPLAIKGPALSIRKFGRKVLTDADLLAFGAMSPHMAAFMRICVEQRKNILISGGTGSGKTTLLNVLSNFIPDGERIITIEDAAELRLAHSHLINLEARPPNAEGRGQIAIRDLVKNALRMRPDRIVVGECRGGEALDMLQAMNTGHDGSLTTLHANSPRDALARLETLVLMAGMDLPLTAIREQIASAIDLVIQQARLPDGRRVITAIVEVAGTESGRIQIQELFRHEQRGRDAEGRVLSRFTGCNAVPAFYETLAESGVQLDLSLFSEPGNGGGA